MLSDGTKGAGLSREQLFWQSHPEPQGFRMEVETVALGAHLHSHRSLRALAPSRACRQLVLGTGLDLTGEWGSFWINGLGPYDFFGATN